MNERTKKQTNEWTDRQMNGQMNEMESGKSINPE